MRHGCAQRREQGLRRLESEALPGVGGIDPVADLHRVLAVEMHAARDGEGAVGRKPAAHKTIPTIAGADDQGLGIVKAEGVGQEMNGAENHWIVGQAPKVFGIVTAQHAKAEAARDHLRQVEPVDHFGPNGRMSRM